MSTATERHESQALLEALFDDDMANKAPKTDDLRAQLSGAPLVLNAPRARRKDDLEEQTGQTDPSSTVTREAEPAPNRLVRIPSATIDARQFTVLQRWEGVVDEVSENAFTATLYDLTDPSAENEFVEIPKQEINLFDIPLIEPGAVFYWHIGYHTGRLGQISRVSEFRFRRAPVWTKGKLKKLGANLDECMEGQIDNGSEGSSET